ncbi:electron transfer flavoprotein alpha subunit apoprotein [Andreprevotia lacus DSM 23236]|jgi:electron transfer flavoprotein alpha subunit|uniref:Electron transfer flavoprotein subunit alpha n=1 Tax=Andreprevotia lacus DSM 23236 TaxID=1121001 RepID=A0A1W1XRC1_9NEIS|nr:FAD-binding protein [Andreprevotia lacus]SMC26061.1 electron transfer flavoprotein alpha subunit apoprotein [Andreprevotia lacus DSM 23236]
MSILILAEHDGQQLKKAARQTISAAQAWGLPVHLLLVGDNTAAAAASAAQVAGVARVIHVDAPHLAHPLAEDVSAIVVGLARDYKVLVSAHTTFAKNILPRAAALLDVAMVADVIGIKAPNTYARPIYAGSVLATVENSDALQVVTVRATSFDAAVDGGNAEITTLPAPAASGKSRWVSEVRNESDQPDLASAPVVISGGRSLGEQFHQLLTPLAQKLEGAVGATRAAVDAGYAPNDWQVGQTGTIVAPGLYIAAGISGAAQHLAGMKDSKIIVAINHDPDAPIFSVADYGLVADLFEALPALTAAIGK